MMILVTGATGRIGRSLMRDLEHRGVPSRALTRDPSHAEGLTTSAQVVIGDLDRPGSLDQAFAGVDRLFLLTPGIGTGQTANAITAARNAGVGRVVFLSSSNVLPEPLPAMGKWHHEREELVRGSGLGWTILRPNGFMTNALEWRGTIAEGGYILDPVGPGRHAVIDPDDIAAVAAAVLTEDGHESAAYTLSGPEALTITNQGRILAATLGRDITIREVATAEEAVQARFPNGAPPALAAALIELLPLMRADRDGYLTDTVAQILGRPPHSFAEWCRRNSHLFR